MKSLIGISFFGLLVLIGEISYGSGYAYPYAYPLGHLQSQSQTFQTQQQPFYNGGFSSSSSGFLNQPGTFKVSRNGFEEAQRNYNQQKQNIFQGLVNQQQQQQQSQTSHNFQQFSPTSHSVNDPFHGVKVTYLRSDATLVPPKQAIQSVSTPSVSNPSPQPIRQNLPISNTGFIQNNPFNQNVQQVNPQNSATSNNDPIVSPNVPISNAQFISRLNLNQINRAPFTQNSPISQQTFNSNSQIRQNLPQLIHSTLNQFPNPTSSTIIKKGAQISDQQLDQILSQDYNLNSFIQNRPISNPVVNQNAQLHHNQQINNLRNQQISNLQQIQQQQQDQIQQQQIQKQIQQQLQQNPLPQVNIQNQQIQQASNPQFQNQQLSNIAFQNQQIQQLSNQPVQNPQISNAAFNPQGPPPTGFNPQGPPPPGFNPQGPPPPGFNPQGPPPPGFGGPEPENGFNPNHLQSFPEPPYESEFVGLPPLDQQDSLELRAYLSKLSPSQRNLAQNPNNFDETETLSSRIVSSAVTNPGQLEISNDELINFANGRSVPQKCAYNTITQGVQGEDCVEIKKK